MKHDDKRKIRKLKKDIKKAGNQHNRRKAKEDLRDRPDEMREFDEPEFGKMSSEWLNGIFKKEKPEDETLQETDYDDERRTEETQGDAIQG